MVKMVDLVGLQVDLGGFAPNVCNVVTALSLETAFMPGGNPSSNPLQVHQGYSLGRFGRLGVKSAALVQFGEFVCRLVTEMCVEMFFFSEVDSAFEGY